MRLQTISNDQASDAWNAMLEDNYFDAAGVEYGLIGPDDDHILTELELQPIVDALDEIQNHYVDVSKANGGAIDAAIVEPIHRTLFPLATAFQLSQLGFWRWLSNVAYSGRFWNFINWRLDSTNQVNWGVTSQAKIVEVYFYRAWIRGHKMHESGRDDPYYYAKKGASDVWRSHILRTDFGRDKEAVKAFLDIVYDDSGKAVIGSSALRKTVIPALRAWGAGASFSHLSYEEVFGLIEKLIKEEG